MVCGVMGFGLEILSLGFRVEKLVFQDLGFEV